MWNPAEGLSSGCSGPAALGRPSSPRGTPDPQGGVQSTHPHWRTSSWSQVRAATTCSPPSGAPRMAVPALSGKPDGLGPPAHSPMDTAGCEQGGGSSHTMDGEAKGRKGQRRWEDPVPRDGKEQHRNPTSVAWAGWV